MTPIPSNLPSYSTDSFQVILEASSATSAQEVVAAATGKYIYIRDISVSTDTAQWVQLLDDSASPVVIVSKKYLPANSVWSFRYGNRRRTSLSKALTIKCGGAVGNISVEVTGVKRA